mgnify:FL=1
MRTLLIAGVCAAALHAQSETVDLVRLRVAVMSDVHLNSEPGTDGTLRKALAWFDAAGIDAAIVAGDITDWGIRSQHETFKRAWDETFACGRGRDGRPVKLLAINGNHDNGGFRYGGPGNYRYSSNDPKLQAELDGQRAHYDRAKQWKEVYGEAYESHFIRTVKGYMFVGSQFESDKSEGLREWFARHRRALPRDKPFFYFQHVHLRGTVLGDWVAQDDGVATELLSDFPNCIAFSGDSHTTLTNERNIWQGAFTSVGTGSLLYVWAPDGRENGWQTAHGTPVQQMPPMGGGGGDGRQAMLMRVYDDRIVLERREFAFTDGERIGPDWVIPLDVRKRPYAWKTVSASSRPYDFASDATVTVHPFRTGKDRLGNSREQVYVEFPIAQDRSDGRVRPFDYEVTVQTRESDFSRVLTQKRVYSCRSWAPERIEHKIVGCTFAREELPLEREMRFVVRACDSWNNKSAPLCSDWMTLPPPAD